MTDLDGVGHGTTLAGRYRLEERLHAAEHTAMWRAVDVMLDRPVGVRLVDAPLAADALDAARRVSVVEDPRLLRVLDVGTEPGSDVSYIVWEFATGESLATRLQRGPLPAERVRALVGEVSRALDRADAAGLHHGRLTPASLVLTPDDGVKVVGLGVDATLTPEGVDTADGPAAAREDAVRLVALLYAGLTARWPFGAVDGVAAAPLVGGQPAPPADLVPGVPNDLDTLCTVTLGPHDDGPRSPGELAEQLAPWGHRTTPAPDRAGQEAETRPAGRFPVRLASTASAVGAAAAAAAGAAGLHREPPAWPGPARGAGGLFDRDGSALPPRVPEQDDAPPAPPEPPAGDPGPRRQATIALVAVGLLVLLGLVFAVSQLRTVGGSGDPEPAPPAAQPADGAATQPPADETTPPPEETGPPPPQIQGVRTLDPQGDGAENDDQAPLAIDADPGTAWSSETYTTAELGGLKEGVGFLLDLGRPGALSGVDLQTAGSGGTVEVRTAPGPGLDGSTVVATADLAGGATEVTFEQPAETQFVVLWFTSLPDVGDGYRIELASVSVR